MHADAIQLYGSSHTVIRGNYMHDMPEVPFIMAADGTDHELIEDNVVEGSSHGYPYITLFSDDSSIVRHNTFADGSCAFNLPCGILRLGAKDSDDPGHGTWSRTTSSARSQPRARPRSPSARTTCSLTTARRAPAISAASRPTSVARPPTATPATAWSRAPSARATPATGLDRGARIAKAGAPAPGNDRCQRAKHKVKKAKKKLRRAKRQVHRADGHKQTRKAKKKLHRAKKKLHRAKKAKHRAC